jgi:hypothetical protein
MKIIYPNEVSKVDFDATTGEPLDAEESHADVSSDNEETNTKSDDKEKDTASGSSEGDSEGDFVPDPDSGFPIDLDDK